MAQQGMHTNSKTGERLARNVQVCNMCFRNFASDRAWEKHWDRKKFPDPSCCQDPDTVGLGHKTNTEGSTIYF
jgi:hypothetical protein